MEEIKIFWDGPFSADEIKNKKNKLFEKSGLYQIYGFHPLYGNSVLLYIGKTEKQKFSERLNNRYELEYNSDSKSTKIYLGVIQSDDKTIQEDKKLQYIAAAETLMINSLKPAYNSSNVKSAKNILDTDYIVYNEGEYRSIYPIFSSKYFWQIWKNYEILEVIAKEYKEEVYADEKEKEYCFQIDENKDIWLVVNENIWDEFGYPLQIAVPKTAKKAIKEFNPQINKKENDKYLYINATDDLKSSDAIEKIKKRIEEIKKKL